MSELQLLKTNWPTAPLGDLCDIVIGRTPSRNRPEFWGGKHPWLSIGDMNQGREIRTTKEKITQLGVSESGSRLIPTGTVLLSFKLSIGKVAVTNIDTYTNEAIAALPILNPGKLSRNFLYWTLRSIRLDEEVDVAAKGKTLNSKKLARLQIPLPPLDEQKRIAAVLDKADALRRQRQESLQLTEQLLQSVFIDMFGDPAKNPMGWPECSIGDLLTSANYGTSAKAGSEGTWPVLRMGNITYEGGWDFSSLKYIDLDTKDERKYLVRNGEILFNRTNSKDLVGKTAVYREAKPMAFAGYLIRCTVNQNADPEYISAFLNSAHGKQILRSMCKSIVGMANINAQELQAITIPKPPVSLQNKFGKIVRSVLGFRIAIIEAAKSDLSLFSSIQQHAFRGELDLSRLLLEEDVEALERTADKLHQVVHVTLPKAVAPTPAKRAFTAPPELEKILNENDAIAEKGEPLPWSADYFQYRILGRALPAPYCFTNIWDAVQQRMPDADYEVVKDLVFEYIADGRLRQRFDKKQKALVFFPRRA